LDRWDNGGAILPGVPVTFWSWQLPDSHLASGGFDVVDGLPVFGRTMSILGMSGVATRSQEF